MGLSEFTVGFREGVRIVVEVRDWYKVGLRGGLRLLGMEGLPVDM